MTPPYLVLHREEFTWPRMSPRAPVRSYFKPLTGRTISPITQFQIRDLKSENSNQNCRLVCSLLHLSSSEPFLISDFKFVIWNLDSAQPPRR